MNIVPRHGNVVGLPARQVGLEQGGLLGVELPAAFLEVDEADDHRIVVVVHPLHIIHDDVAQRGELIAHLQNLIGLFLVFTDHKGGIGVIDSVQYLVRQAVRVDADNNATGSLSPKLGVQPLGTVVADNGNPSTSSPSSRSC